MQAAGARVRLGKEGEGMEVSPRIPCYGEGLAPVGSLNETLTLYPAAGGQMDGGSGRARAPGRGRRGRGGVAARVVFLKRALRQWAACIIIPNPVKCPGGRWVEAAGARVRLDKECEGVEVSPRVSYSGEGLAPLCRGRTLRAAHDPFLQARLP